jgi:LPXTG-site transpeptidase (sortase) family protein
LTNDLQTGFADICADAVIESFPLASLDPVDIDRRVTFNFGTVTNTGPATQTLTITYRAFVLDNAQNQDGSSLNNAAQLTWDNITLDPVSTTVRIVEPDLFIEKTADISFITVGSEATFILTIQHTPNSHADALDVVVEDVLPTTLDFVSGSLNCTAGDQDPSAADCFYNPATRTIHAEWDIFALGGGLGQIRFRVRGNATLPPNTNVTNIGTVAWTSMPGDLTTPQSFTPNPFATERFYDPGDPINLYSAEDAMILTPLGNPPDDNNQPSPPKSTSTPIISGFIIPVTGFAPNMNTILNSVNRPAYGSTSIAIEIPVLKVDTSIVGVKLQNGNWDVSWLQNQIGWLNGTAYPTWSGNSVLTGHAVNADGKPGIFSKLKYLKAGEYVFIYDSGFKHIYKVVTNTSVQPNDISVLKHEDRAYITLITCDNYDKKSSTFLHRIAVRAVLVSIEAIK